MLWDFYRELIRLRKEEPALRELDENVLEVKSSEENGSLYMRRRYGKNEIFMVFNFGDRVADFGTELPVGEWKKRLDSAETCWMGPGSHIPQVLTATGNLSLPIEPKSFCILKRISSLDSSMP
jgi:maltooligosyltrehalose trehalohydrolase